MEPRNVDLDADARSGLRRRLEALRERMDAACEAVGREDRPILVAVTKTVDDPVVRALLDLGVRDIGENRAEAAERRFGALPGPPQVVRHFIGHLQRNKVKRVLPVTDRLHSLDSARLARALQKRADLRRDRGRRDEDAAPLPCLVEVNISGEEAKHGVAPGSEAEVLDAAADCPDLQVDGLMGMAAMDTTEDAARRSFALLRERAEALAAAGALPANPVLSMGMSGDFEAACREGSTMVRIGTALVRGPDDGPDS